MMKQSKKREKNVKNESNHKGAAQSSMYGKQNNKSFLSSQGKKSKSQNKINSKLKTSSSKSVPKIKIKNKKFRIDSENSEQLKSKIQQYFILENRIFPVANSDQRRTINRYFWTTDLTHKQNKQLKDNFTISTGFLSKIDTKQTGVMTQQSPKTTKDYNLQINILTQTKSQQTITAPIAATKTTQSFQQILNQLQFLYLPNSKNFQSLNQGQKQHYKNLFVALANKLLPEKTQKQSQLSPKSSSQPKVQVQLSPRTVNQFVAFQVQKRISHQVNCTDIEIQKGIPTNLLCILSYLSNLFCFIQVQYREQLLRGLNTPFGYYNQQRFTLLIKEKPLKRMQKILPDTIYSELQEQFFAEDDELDQQTIQYMHIHNKAIFDNLNDELNLFRPFFSCNGQPYPWFIPGKITFFSIGQDDIQLVLQKAKVKILQSASLLCGVHCDVQPPFSKFEINQSNILKDVRQQRERKFIFSEIFALDESVDIEDQRTKIMVKLSEAIYNELVNQVIGQIQQFDQTPQKDSFVMGSSFDFVTD